MKTILVCVAGITPQIITETLYYYIIEKKPPVWIDEINVLTTSAGKEVIINSLLKKESGIFYKFLSDYNIGRQKIKFNENSVIQLGGDSYIKDISTDMDSAIIGNEIVNFIKNMTIDKSTRIICSIAGGRKTMSVYLSLGLQLYGREQDILSHTLVSSDFESTKDFFYIPPVPKNIEIKDKNEKIIKIINTKDAKIVCSEIIFVRLRNFLNIKDELFYDDLVNIIQKKVDYCGTKLISIDLKNRALLLGNKKVILKPIEICIYNLFLSNKKKCEQEFCGDCTDCYMSLNEMRSQELYANLLEFYKFIYTENSGQYERLKESLKKDSKGDDFFSQNISKINKTLKQHLNPFEFAVYKISKIGKYNKRYGIYVDKKNILS
ncbi:MAG: TIGR02584 family CRISPR-associated protein [Candidatus Acididesulfobacter diazotrophicus]|uniref:TIGR02584 family CRISPR-associated protein n=1 Tax=Candidatus Acididesulfobacter diazotrophicus TaxID=2597226 RepID=A0A519BQ95_9DELT|nr:MAG: TIGR02584 family CRISPR-associated protein [Candidatus Acididesulfobacter diazotrophicus]